MFITIQFPFFDTRPLFNDFSETNRYPNWPFPNQGQHFIHHFGVISKRKSGENNSFSDELEFVDVSNYIKFNNIHQIKFFKLFRPHFSVRRLYFDGSFLGRIEIGIKLKGFNASSTSSRSAIEGYNFTFEAMLNAIKALEVTIKMPSEGAKTTCNLKKLPSLIAKSFELATNNSGNKAPMAERVKPCRPPIFFIEYYDYKYAGIKLPKNYSNIPLDNEQMSAQRRRRIGHFSFDLFSFESPDIQCFLLRKDISFKGKISHEEKGNISDIRASLLRAHGEFNALKAFFNQKDDSTINPTRLKELLSKKQSMLIEYQNINNLAQKTINAYKKNILTKDAIRIEEKIRYFLEKEFGQLNSTNINTLSLKASPHDNDYDTTKRTKVFLCYAREDSEIMDDFVDHLEKFNSKDMEILYDRNPTSENMHSTFTGFARECNVALLLVTARFLNPESYANKYEIPILKERQQSKNVILIGIRLSNASDIKIWNADGDVYFFPLTNNDLTNTRNKKPNNQKFLSEFAVYKQVDKDDRDQYHDELRKWIRSCLHKRQ